MEHHFNPVSGIQKAENGRQMARKMKEMKIIICIVLTAFILIQLGWPAPAEAADNAPQPAPERLRVEAINDEAPNIEPPIGYNQFDKYYADLKCDKLTPPVGVSSPRLYLNYYIQEVNKPYKPVKPAVLKEGNLPASSTEDNMVRFSELSSGTVYYTYAKAYYTYTKETATYTSSESTASNTVKFLTDIAINAYSYGPNQIKIEWDDVWNSGKRMDYKLYVSENKTFTNAPAIYIGQEQIGQNGPVTVNEAAGKLEYIHTVRDPGRVYYIKVVPDTSETELQRSAESPTVTVSSYILAKTTKMSVTDAGTIWRLEWSPVVTGLADSSIKVSYQIYRGSGTGGSIEQYMASVDDTTFFLTLQPGEENYYFIIKAMVTSNGQDVYPGIRIQSQKIYVKESEVASTPAVPELVLEFSNGVNTIISYEAELSANSATILWRTPLKGNGKVDEEVRYDIWLISDPNLLDDPPSGTMIASSVKMNDSNFVMSGTKLIGYKFKINDLVPNSTYYFKIVAKKEYVEFVDNALENITLQSDAAMKIIITPTLGSIDQPVVPGRPPFELKRVGVKDMVTTTTATVTLKNKWYEMYTTIENGRSAWVYKTPKQISDIGKELKITDLLGDIENGNANPLEFRKVEYDNGVTIDVGCVEYTPDIDYDNIETFATNKVIGFPVTPNDPDENVSAPDVIQDGEKHNIDIVLTDLEPNTTYIVWVRAARRSVDLISGPSDPIIVTTIPDLPVTIEKPTVPVFNYNNPADTHIDLAWNFNPLYTYYLEYGTSDDRSKAADREIITPDMLEFSSFYRVKDLKPDTLYYFWIQAEATNSAGDTKRSDFSDSYLVKTSKDIPPATPKGFGVKSTDGSVTRNSITYEWIMEDGMEYILEIASDISYKDSKKFQAKNVSEYTVGELRSNFRYYARLYAYDPAKKLTSEPTQSVTVRTLRSSDDYDSSEDTEDIISGDFVIKDTVSVNGVWTVRITGVNADRFIQSVQTDSILDYCMDLKAMPAGTKEIKVIISQRVFKALGMLGENLLIKTLRNTVVIRPGVLADSSGAYGSSTGDANFIIAFVLDSTTAGSNIRNMNFRTPVSQLSVGLSDGILLPLGRFERPLKVIYEYTAATWYKEGSTSGYMLAAGAADWQKSATAGAFDVDRGIGELSFETFVPGRMAVAEPGMDYYEDISGSYARQSIANIVSVHELKSVKGSRFEPDKYLTVGDAAKFMLDMLDADYGSNYMTIAAKAGIVQSSDAGSPNSNCTREKLIAMAVRTAEIKTSQKALATVDHTAIYKDIGQVSAVFLPKIRFALESGVITSRFSDTFGPKDPVTRAESMILLEKLLRYAGEL